MPNLRDRFPIYRRLLRLYPEPYRRTYELSMLQTLADMLDAAPSTAARRSLWLRLAADLPTSIVQQQRIYIGEVMVHDMPKFVKHNAILAALMLAPFSIAVFANLLDQILRHQTLYESWVWDTPHMGNVDASSSGNIRWDQPCNVPYPAPACNGTKLGAHSLTNTIFVAAHSVVCRRPIRTCPAIRP